MVKSKQSMEINCVSRLLTLFIVCFIIEIKNLKKINLSYKK